MKKLNIIPGPYRVCEEEHEDGKFIIRSAQEGHGDIPGDLVVALVVGGGPEEYDLPTAKLLASAPALMAVLEKCFWHLGDEIKRNTLNDSASDGTQALTKEVARVLDSISPPIGDSNPATPPTAPQAMGGDGGGSEPPE